MASWLGQRPLDDDRGVVELWSCGVVELWSCGVVEFFILMGSVFRVVRVESTGLLLFFSV